MRLFLNPQPFSNSFHSCNRSCTYSRSSPCNLLMPTSSSQATLCHTNDAIYRCFLPDLTGFIALRCIEPNFQYRLARATLQLKTSNRDSAPL